MTSIKKIFLSIIILLVILFISLNLFLFFKGKDILNERLSRAMGRNIEVHKIWLKLPFSIFIDGVTIDGVSPAKEILVKLGFSNVFRSQFVIKRIVLKEAAVTLIRDASGKITFKGIGSLENDAVVTLPPSAEKPSAPSSTPVETQAVKKNQAARIEIKNIVFEDSSLIFLNEKNVSEEDNLKFKQVKLENSDLRIKDFVWPLEPKTVTYTLKGMLSVPDFAVNRKMLKSDGWINVLKKDMDGNLDVAESESESSLHAEFVSKNNDMKVNGNIKMSNFMKPQPKGDSGSKGIDQMIFGALSQMGVEVGLDFSFQTKMDHFEITNVSFTGNVVTKQMPSSPSKSETK